MIIKKITLLFCLICTLTTYSQDAQFTQFFAAANYLNPAFAGATFQNRAAMTYRHQWPGVPKAYTSMNFSSDFNFEKINSGVGFNIFRDNAGTGGLKHTNVSMQVSHQFKLKRDLYFRPAIQFGLLNKSLDMNSLTFGDQLIRDNAPTTLESSKIEPITNFDFGSGLLIYSSKLWAGFSVHHLNQPNEALIGNEAILPMKFSLHGGYKLYLNTFTRRQTDEEISFAFNYKSQGKFDQFDIGFYYTRSAVILGLWYRGIPGLKAYQQGYQNNDAIALLIATEVKALKIGYSYDITISRLVSNTTGSHEVTLVYQWASKGAPPLSKQKRIVPCPKF
ncbi:MAG: type IX secretion system PorP/SprF family membrane protein [Flavobacteriales bacterium]|jgi:type IX secretion system PorP/SprF family membrane protein